MAQFKLYGPDGDSVLVDHQTCKAFEKRGYTKKRPAGMAEVNEAEQNQGGDANPVPPEDANPVPPEDANPAGDASASEDADTKRAKAAKSGKKK